MRDPIRMAQVLNLMAKGLYGSGNPGDAVGRQREALRLPPDDSDLRAEYEADFERMVEEAAKPHTWWRRKGRRLALATFVLVVLTGLIILLMRI